MPEYTPKLGLKKALGNETVSRAAHNENLDLIDQNAAAQADLDIIRSDSTKELVIEVRTSDPEDAEVGRIWIRSDL